DIARALRVAGGHVFDGREKAVNRDGGFQVSDGLHGTDDSGAARHVVFHFLHAFGGFDGDTASVERNTFADETEVIFRCRIGRRVAHDDQRGRRGATLRDTQEGAHAELAHPVLIENFEREAARFGHLPGTIGKGQRGEQIGGLDGNVAGQVGGFGDYAAFFEGGAEGGVVRWRRDG